MTGGTESHYEAIVIGAGVAGIYQIKRLADLGVERHRARGRRRPRRHLVLEPLSRAPASIRRASPTATPSRASCCEEWDWKERFSGQPENLRYLNYVADKFDLRQHMQFDCTVESAALRRGRTTVAAAPRRRPRADLPLPDPGDRAAVGADPAAATRAWTSFKGRSFHTYNWPHEPVDMAGKRVAVIGTGATGVQVIGEIADKVGELTVFQRRPNWCAPLQQRGRSPTTEMADIKPPLRRDLRHLRPHAGRLHPRARPPRRSTRCRARSGWRCGSKLYGEPGFGIWLANFREIFMDEEANAEFSEFIAEQDPLGG